MPRKPKMTVTSRFFEERAPIASRNVPSPFPNPPPNREAIARLAFRGPSPKLDGTAAGLAHAIGVASLRNAILFLDTNIFTTDLDISAWDAFFTRQIFITPNVYWELRPWLKNPFCNKTVRDRVVEAIKHQVNSASSSQESPPFELSKSRDIPKIEVLFFNEDFTKHGYNYYLNLLALRKMIGPMTDLYLTKHLGHRPTKDQFMAEVQRNFGRRGFLLAKKGLEAANSPNKLTDEHLVVMAVLTAIMRGREAFIFTRDPDVLEQYYKLLCLMKEHYRSMLIAEKYAASPESMAFREVPIESDGVQPPKFSGSSVLEWEIADVDFNPLPKDFHFVNIYCFLLGGGPSEMKITECCFCAETEMAQMLKIKAITGGLSTDKFDGRNCTIHTVPFTSESSKVIVSIGKDTMFPPSKADFRMDDFINALYENEKRTNISYIL